MKKIINENAEQFTDELFNVHYCTLIDVANVKPDIEHDIIGILGTLKDLQGLVEKVKENIKTTGQVSINPKLEEEEFTHDLFNQHYRKLIEVGNVDPDIEHNIMGTLGFLKDLQKFAEMLKEHIVTGEQQPINS